MTGYQLHVKNWKGCTRCLLKERRTKVVLARGKLPCDALFVGEAPGPSEDLIGVPFVGPAGHLLNVMIAESCDLAGLGMPRLAFTNLVCCIPLGEGSSKFEQPPNEGVKACAPRLVEFVKLADPKLLICVGQLSETWLMPAKKNGKRGIDLGDWDDGSRATIGMTHPAAILRANEANRDLMQRRVTIQLANAWRKLCQS